MLAHGVLPRSQYFLIVTPERMYGWRQEDLLPSDVLPEFTVDAQKALAPYFAKLNQDPVNISPRAFELVILTWLNDITRSQKHGPEVDASLSSLIDSGLLSSLHRAEIEMNAAK
jgi:hypothetical protein